MHQKKPSPVMHSLLFCLFAFALSWAWWAWRLFPLWQQPGLEGSALRAALGPLDISAGMFGPLLAALVLRLLTRNPAIPRPLGLKRNWHLYLLALAGPVLAVVATLSMAGTFTWAGASPLPLLVSLLPITLIASLTALGEEFGWRGTLLPLLLHLGKGKAALITGAVWGLWHLPILLTGLTFPGEPVLLASAVFIVSTVLISFWFTDLFVLSGQSIALAGITHGMLNALTEIANPLHLPGSSPLIFSPFGLLAALFLFALAMVIRNRMEKAVQK
jgi:uncharacterized protein